MYIDIDVFLYNENLKTFERVLNQIPINTYIQIYEAK